jgi:hypothetical protein
MRLVRSGGTGWDMPQADIARILGCRPGTIASLVLRGIDPANSGANSALQGRKSRCNVHRRHRLMLLLWLVSKPSHTVDLGGAAAHFAAFAPHLQETGWLPRSSGTTFKHRDRGRCSQRSAARITSRHTRRNRGATEVLGDNPVPSTLPRRNRAGWRHEQHAPETRRSLRPASSIGRRQGADTESWLFRAGRLQTLRKVVVG